MFKIEIPDGPSIFLRPADTTDVRMFHDWRNDPWIVSKGRSGKLVSWEEHESWFLEAVKDESRRIYVILIDHRPFGAVFFTGSSSKIADISLYLLKPMTGRGFGVPLIKAICRKQFIEWAAIKRIRAEILSNNEASLRVFEKAGFVREGGESDFSVWILDRPSKREIIPHNKPVFDDAEVSAARAAVACGMWVNGEWTVALEDRLEHLTGIKAVCVDSGFTALKIALRLFNVGRGDEVIVPAYCCVAVPNAVLAVGATPVPVEVNSNDGNLSIAGVASSRGKKTAAVIAVNTFGCVPDYDALRTAGECPVIEDGSHGMKYCEDSSWRISGDVAICSFYATKLIGCGQGGAILVPKPEYQDRVRDLRSYSDKMLSGVHENGQLSEMEAAIAYRQLDKFTNHVSARKRLVEAYSENLQSLAKQGYFELPIFREEEIPYRYILRCKSSKECKALKNSLQLVGINSERPVDPWLPDSDLSQFKEAKELYGCNLSLPIYPTLSHDKVLHICDHIKVAIEGSKLE